MRAYVYDLTDADQRELHDSGVEKTVEDLKRIGVLYWRFDGDDALDRLDQLAAERQYKNRDQASLIMGRGRLTTKLTKTFIRLWYLPKPWVKCTRARSRCSLTSKNNNATIIPPVTISLTDTFQLDTCTKTKKSDSCSMVQVSLMCATKMMCGSASTSRRETCLSCLLAFTTDSQRTQRTTSRPCASSRTSPSGLPSTVSANC